MYGEVLVVDFLHNPSNYVQDYEASTCMTQVGLHHRYHNTVHGPLLIAYPRDQIKLFL